MWTKRRVRARGVLGSAALAIVMTAGAAWAETTTERPTSILILPKIVSDGTRDTAIEITNTSNSLTYAHCYYVNGAPSDPTLPPGPTNPPLWQELDFFLFLTRQQPTGWIASLGRDVNPFDIFAGFDPGLIPPVPFGFEGELVCVQTDQSGSPIGGNALIGSATLFDDEGDTTKYNAIGLPGIDVQQDETLLLDNTEYGSCPSQLGFTHFSQGVEDPVLGPGSEVVSHLSLVPCSHDFENGVPANVGFEIVAYNEFEEQFSTDINFTCRLELDLDDAIFLPNAGLFSTWKFSRMEVSNVCSADSLNPGVVCSADAQCLGGGTCDGFTGVVGILESAHVAPSGAVTRSAQNLHELASEDGAIIEMVDINPDDNDD